MSVHRILGSVDWDHVQTLMMETSTPALAQWEQIPLELALTTPSLALVNNIRLI